MHGDHFAQHAVRADLEPSVGEIIAADLPLAAHRDAGIKIAARADPGDPGHRNMRTQPHAAFQHGAGTDMTKGTDFDTGADRRAVFHHRGGMHAHPAAPSVIMALNSASAQSVSPTKAWPSNFHTGPRCASFLTGMRSRSPGTTGLRKRAFSMVRK
jgi:hypothetical protein